MVDAKESSDAGAPAQEFSQRLERAAEDAGGPTAAARIAVGQWAVPYTMWSDATLGRPARSPLEVWLSLFPFSPIFGVRWFWLNMPTPETMNLSAFSAPSFGASFGDIFAAPGAAARQKNEDPEIRAAREERKLSMGGVSGASVIDVDLTSPAPETRTVDVAQVVREVAPPAPAAPPAPSASSPAASSSTLPSNDNNAAELGAVQVAASVSTSPATPSSALSDGDVATPATLYTSPPALVDDLQKINGVGERLEALLNELGVYQFEQLAAFSSAELRWLDEKLFVFKGRAERDRWVEQAKELADPKNA